VKSDDRGEKQEQEGARPWRGRKWRGRKESRKGMNEGEWGETGRG
jgi:hypothetical protein